MAKHHTRILDFPYYQALAGGRLVDLTEQQRGQRLDLVFDFKEFIVKGAPELSWCDGRPCEKLDGMYQLRRIRFLGVASLRRNGLFKDLSQVALEDPCRELRSMLAWQPPEQLPIYLLSHSGPEDTGLRFSARGCRLENPPQDQLPGEIITQVRYWSQQPAQPARLVPAPKILHQRYGGDPVTTWVNGRIFHRRLFVGGLGEQRMTRPEVDVVLNLGELPSRWSPGQADQAGVDRWQIKGEGALGMTPAEIAVEARWVMDHLKAGKSILVHCAAGMNRSVTVCCAVLILMEGLSAEDALARVRQHHPWARPDSYHWLALRWLAKETRLKRLV